MIQNILRALIILWIALIPFKASAGEKEKNLARTYDPILIVGEKAPSLKGVPVDSLALFVWRDGSPVQIPFQVDEKTPNGHYVFAHYFKNSEIDDGLLDANDEMVFMAADMGSRPANITWPKGATDCVEIIATDPDDGGVAFAYLFSFKDTAPTCPVDYVICRPEKDEIETVDFFTAYDPDAPISTDRLIIKPSFGGSGYDVADRLKIRVKAKTALNLVEIYRTEEDFNVEITAYTDGSVRVLRQTRAWQTLFWGIPSPSSTQTSIYYRNQMQFPITIDVPFDVSMFFKEVSLRVSIDTPSDVPGLRRYYNNHNTDGVDVDGKMSPREKNINKGQVHWQVVAGTTPQHPEGWFSVHEITSSKSTSISLPLWYVDDVDFVDPPENIQGSCGNLGFMLQGIDMLKKGYLKIIVKQFPVINYKPGDENEFLKIDQRPLVIETAPVMH